MNMITAEASVYQASARVLKSTREKQKREEFEVRSEHGLGKTDSEYPETFEQDQKKGRSDVMDSVMFERQIPVKGSFSIPEKNPAVKMLVPTTFFSVICWMTGRLSGSYCSSGWRLELPVNQNALCTFSISTFDTTMFFMKPPRPGAVLKFIPVKELPMYRCSTYTSEIPPDISLPKASAEPRGVCKWTFLIWMLVEGVLKVIP